MFKVDCYCNYYILVQSSLTEKRIACRLDSVYWDLWTSWSLPLLFCSSAVAQKQPQTVYEWRDDGVPTQAH